MDTAPNESYSMIELSPLLKREIGITSNNTGKSAFAIMDKYPIAAKQSPREIAKVEGYNSKL